MRWELKPTNDHTKDGNINNTTYITNMNTKKITLTATDKIGRTETINLKLSNKIAERLLESSALCYPSGEPYSMLIVELNSVLDDFKYGYHPISRYQYNRIVNFLDLVYHKFYNYTLTIDVA